MSDLVTLRELNMSYNSGLVGVLPMEVGSMASLTVLHIYSAGIHGEYHPLQGRLRSIQLTQLIV